MSCCNKESCWLKQKFIKELENKDLVIVPELNYLGQFASILRQDRINSVEITQYTGLPFKVKDLVERVNQQIESYKQGQLEL